MKKRLLSILLVVCMVCTLLPVSAFAAATSGVDGNITWSYSNGALTVSGTGAMNDYGVYSTSYPDGTEIYYPGAPWTDYYASIRTVVINSGVTTIGEGAFTGCYNLTNVSIPEGITSIGSKAFAYCGKLASIKFEGNAPTTFGSNVFGSCASGFKILAPENNDTWLGTAYNAEAGTWHGYPIEFYSVGPEIIASGTDGNITWSLDSNGLLTITGEGSIGDYEDDYVPWEDHISDVKSVRLGSWITDIGSYTFLRHNNLASFSIEGGSEAFSVIDGVLFNKDKTSLILYPSGRTVTSYTMPDGVTSIATYAFCGTRGSLEELNTNDVKSFSKYSLYNVNCKITVPETITYLGDYAFMYSGITEASVSVSSIPKGAFSNCSKLEKIFLLSTLSYIGENAFFGTGLKQVYYVGSNLAQVTSMQSGNSGLRDAYNNNPCGYCGVNLLWSFDPASGTLTISGTGAIPNWSSNFAMPWYDYIRTANNANGWSVKHIVVSEGITDIGDYSFYYCTDLQDVSLPSSLTRIGNSAFGKVGLKSISIPAGVETVDRYAFYEAGSLREITVGNPTVELMYASLGYTGIKDVYFAGTAEQWTTAANDSGLGSAVIHTGGKCAPGYSKTVINAKEASTEEEGYTGDTVCAGCGALIAKGTVINKISTVEVDSGTCGEDLTWTLDSEGTLTISGTGAMTNYYYYSSAPWYSNRSSIVSVVIGDGVTSIGDSAFEGCSSLTSVTIPDSVQSIGGSAFYNCSGLTSVTIPDGVQSIGGSAFYNCSRLTSVTIPDSVQSIGGSAFYSCYGLTSVTIGSGVTSIGERAFSGCSRLSHIYFKGSMPTIGSNAFSGDSAFAFYPDGNESYANAGTYGAAKLIWLPDGDPEEMIYSGDCGENIVWRLTRSGVLKLSGSGKMYDYSSATQPWKDISFGITGVEIADGVESIGIYAFYNCKGLTSVTIGDSVQSIGSDAFYNCDGLTSVTIPDSVTSIGERAFSGCSSLTSVTIPDGVTSIGRFTFYNCAFTSVTIPDSVTSIVWGAFEHCSGLTSVTIPYNVTLIDSQAFLGCSGLTSVTFEGKPNSIGSSAFEGVTATACYYLEDNWPASKLQDYGGKLTWKMLTRHSLDSEYLTGLPESEHNYAANYNEKFEINEDGAVYITLKFSDETSLGTNDILFVVDQNGKTVASYSSTEAAGQTLVVDGSKATIWINADDVGSGYGFKLDSVKVDYLHHIYSDVVTAPTCTEQGYTTRTCEFCGAVSVGSYVDALGHNFVEGICTRCHTLEVADSGSCGSYAKWTLGTNGVLTVTGSGSVSSSPWRTNHAADIKSVVIGKDITSLCNNAFSGCTNLSSATFEGKAVSLGGSNVFYNCAPDFTVTATKGDVSWTRSGAYNEQDGTWNGYKIVFVGGHDHAYSEVITLEPTCTEVGYKTRTCAICGDVEIIPISARGHVYDIVVTDPCCTKGGYTTYTCRYCDYSYEGDYIIATGHNFSESVIAATCTTAGYTLHTCSCGVFYTSDYVEATGHSYTQKVIAPTCTASGYTLNTCSCGVSTITDPLPATGHDFGEWVMTVQPSCIQTGIETRTCSDCGFLEMHDTGVFGSHVTNLVGAVTATCGSAGYTGDEVCEICENVVTAGEQIEPCAHAWGKVVYTWAEDGSSCTASRVCGNDETHIETAEAVITSEVTTPATCTEMGITTYTATFEEEWAEAQTLEVADVETVAHIYGAPVFTWNGYSCSAAVVCSCGDMQPVECTVTSAVTKEATKTSEGVRTYTATVVIDGQTYTSTATESIPKLDDGGSVDIFTTIINAIKSAVDNIINSILSIFRFK